MSGRIYPPAYLRLLAIRQQAGSGTSGWTVPVLPPVRPVVRDIRYWSGGHKEEEKEEILCGGSEAAWLDYQETANV